MAVVATRGPNEDPAAIQAALPFVDRIWLPVLKRSGAGLRSARALLSGQALQQALYDEPEARSAVAEALATFEPGVVLAHLLRTLPWLPDPSPPLVVDLQDAIAAQYREGRGLARGWRGLAMRLEQKRVKSAEQQALERADAVSFISVRDQALVINGSETNRSIVAGAAVDLERFSPRPIPPEPGTIGFAGKLSTASNEDMVTHFARDLLPLIRSGDPGARFRIFGPEAGRAIQALDGRPGVERMGFVEDLSGALARCWITVCPLRFGSGVQNKVLESLAVGTPVICTEQVAESLGAEAREALVIAGSGRDYAVEVLALLGDSDRREELSQRGRAFVEAHHAPSVALAPLVALVEELDAKARMPRASQ